MIQSFRDLEVYKESYDLAIIVNREVNKLPIFERNDLGSQLRRCSKSPPANIAEGWAKRRFPKVHLSMAKDLGFWRNDFCSDLIKRYQYLGGKLVNLRDKWKSFD